MNLQLKHFNVNKRSSKEAITYLYTQFQSSKPTIQSKSSFNSNCSDQKLMLYDIIQAKKVNYSNKGKQFSSKLKEAKMNLLNNTTDEPNESLVSHKCKLDNFPKGFQDKYLELTHCIGSKGRIQKSSSTIDLKSLTPKRTKENESKVERLKNEIMTSIQPKVIYINDFIYQKQFC